MCALLFAPAVVSAQAVDGTVELGYGRASYDAGGDRTSTGSFTQGYTVAYRSALWDPRFLTYAGELTFNRNALTLGGEDSRSRQTGFRATANLFSQRPLRGSIRASRGFGGESANYPNASSVRGGLGLPAGATPELHTARSEFGMNWQLTAKSLPRVDLSYQRDSARVAAGSLDAVQQQRSVQALVAREGPRLSNTVRYQQNAFDTDVSQAYRQRYSELGYELLAKATPRTWGTVRAGRRTTESAFDLPPQFTDLGVGAYRPPPGGEVALYYGQATLTHQPTKGLSADMSVGIDRERSAAGSTSAALASARTSYIAPAGITVHGIATYGERGQEADGTKLLVLTRGLSTGADYRLTSRVGRIGVAYETGRGWNQSDRGVEGESSQWRGRLDASTDLLRFVHLSAGHDRARSTDDLLPFGNQRLERTQVSARSTLTPRVTLSATSEIAWIDRGFSPSIRTRYTQETATASFELLRERRISMTAGRFISRSLGDIDSNEYIGIAFSGALIGPLQLAATIRREHTQSSAARLGQDGYYSTSSLDYRLRLFTFSLEHRYTNLALSTAERLDPLTFTGNQLQFRVIRKFGFTP
jgi:hypothetical protein